MASTVKRRPLPALVALLALLVLTGVVWWRVLNRADGTQHDATPCPTTPPASVVLPAPSAVTLLVLNSTNRAGIATKARAALTQIGFSVPRAAGNDSPKMLNKIKTTAQIRYGPAAATSARLVRYYFPGSSILHTENKTRTVTVALGTKYRGVASATTVRARLAKDRAVAGSPTPVPSASASCAS